MRTNIVNQINQFVIRLDLTKIPSICSPFSARSDMHTHTRIRAHTLFQTCTMCTQQRTILSSIPIWPIVLFREIRLSIYSRLLHCSLFQTRAQHCSFFFLGIIYIIFAPVLISFCRYYYCLFFFGLTEFLANFIRR